MQKRLARWSFWTLVSGITGLALAAAPNSAPQAAPIQPEAVQNLKPIAIQPQNIPPAGKRNNTEAIVPEIQRVGGLESIRPAPGGSPERFPNVKPGLADPAAVRDQPANPGGANSLAVQRPEPGRTMDPAARGAARDAALIQNELNAMDDLGAGDFDRGLGEAGGPDARLNRLRDLQPGGEQDGLGSAESFHSVLGDPNRGPNQPGRNGPAGAVSAPDRNSFGVDGFGIVSDGANKPTTGRAEGAATGSAGAAGSAGGAAAGSAQRSEPNRSTPGTTQSTDPATGSTTTKTRGADGSTTVTTTFPGEQDNQGSTQTVQYDSQGNPVAVQNSGSGYGGMSTGDSYVRNSDGTWTHVSASSEDGGRTWSSSGPEILYRAPAIAGPRQGGASNVDPDSPQGGGGAVGHGEKHKDPKMVEARDRGVGPGARPDENQTVGGAPRLNVDLGGTVVNPPPGEQPGGGPAHQGFNPNSTRDDDFGPRTP